MARTDQAQVALACLEMSKPEVAMRLMAATASVDLQRLRTGRLGDSDWVRLTRHLGILADLNVVFINTNFGLSLTDLVEHCLKLAQRRRLDLLVVDYIQLLTAEPEAPGAFCDPHEALGRLKHLAVELDLAVVAVSQLSRRAGERGDQPPADRPPWAPAQPSRSPTSSDSFTPVAPRGHGRRTSSGPHSSSSCATTSARLGWSPCGSTARTAGSPTFS
jgi:replicative DNA helicase